MSDVPAYLVSDLDRLADRPRSVLSRESWFPLALFGVLLLIGAAVFDRWDPETTASWLYWALAGPLGGLAIMGWFAFRSVSLGIRERSQAVYVGLWALIVFGCVAASSLAEPPWTFPAVFGVLGLLNVALGLLDRSAGTAVVGAAIVAIGIASGVGELSAAAFNAILGGFLLATGVIAYVTR